jgi:endonuclease/exonuclease/phosphatase (EEP) superfamily protein YafD
MRIHVNNVANDMAVQRIEHIAAQISSDTFVPAKTPLAASAAAFAFICSRSKSICEVVASSSRCQLPHAHASHVLNLPNSGLTQPSMSRGTSPVF